VLGHREQQLRDGEFSAPGVEGKDQVKWDLPEMRWLAD
jgi:hypothetical protein